MKYEVLYDTQIEKTYRKKGEIIEFKEGTDSGFIERLVRDGVIREAEREEGKQAKKTKE